MVVLKMGGRVWWVGGRGWWRVQGCVELMCLLRCGDNAALLLGAALALACETFGVGRATVKYCSRDSLNIRAA